MVSKNERRCTLKERVKCGSEFNFNFNFNFSVFSKQIVTVILLTFRFTRLTTKDVYSVAYNGQKTMHNFS
jgi:hypothetical protein